MNTIQNTTTHAVGIGPGFRSAGILRHSRTHRAKVEEAEQQRETIVIATRDISSAFGAVGVSDALAEIKAWALSGGRQGTPIFSESSDDAWSNGLHITYVISIMGQVVLPAVVGGWKIVKATTDQELRAKRMHPKERIK